MTTNQILLMSACSSSIAFGIVTGVALVLHKWTLPLAIVGLATALMIGFNAGVVFRALA